MPSIITLEPVGGWIVTQPVRIAPVSAKEQGVFTKLFIGLTSKVSGVNPPNIFRVLMRHGRLFRYWLPFASRLMPYGTLERRDTELAILRAGWNCRCRYEWAQHIDIGLRAGLSVADVARVANGPTDLDWEPKEQALLLAVDELHSHRLITDATWSVLEMFYSHKDIMEIMLLVGHYEMLAGVINSTGVELEDELRRKLEGIELPVVERYSEEEEYED